MFFQSISFGLLALSLVYALPSPAPADAILRSTSNAIVSVKITSVATLNPVVTFPGDDEPTLEVLVGQGALQPGDFGVWDRDELSADKYIFTNHGTGQEISVNEDNDHLVTSSEAPGTVFAVESAGGGEFVIKLPNADSVWEAIFDGTSPIFGRIALRPASGSVYQRWKFT
ncbi:hypothetical protein B0H13DRAFT_2005261 [Mycena leptocephala]|nr:hypothetical protein B0H13DRAFT_2005261 [Mycena leptocephala]